MERKKTKKKKNNYKKRKRTTNQQNIPKRKNPTFFLAIKIREPETCERIKIVQEQLLSHHAELKVGMIPISKFHLTIFVLYITSNTQLAQIYQNLTEWAQMIRGQNSFLLNLFGLGEFGKGRVMWVGLKEKEDCGRLIGSLHEKFKSSLPELVAPKLRWEPHMTIYKTTYRVKQQKIQNESPPTLVKGGEGGGPPSLEGYQGVKQQIHFIQQNESPPTMVNGGEEGGPPSCKGYQGVKQQQIHFIQQNKSPPTLVKGVEGGGPPSYETPTISQYVQEEGHQDETTVQDQQPNIPKKETDPNHQKRRSEEKPHKKVKFLTETISGSELFRGFISYDFGFQVVEGFDLLEMAGSDDGYPCYAELRFNGGDCVVKVLKTESPKFTTPIQDTLDQSKEKVELDI